MFTKKKSPFSKPKSKKHQLLTKTLHKSKTLHKGITKKTTTSRPSLNSWTLTEKKHAYNLVANDLWKALKKAKNNQRVRFSNFGSFVKTQHQMYSALKKKTYLYDKISFRLFNSKKQELD